MVIDANKTLRDLRTVVSRVLVAESEAADAEHAHTMAQLFLDLDKHLRAGNAMPDDWALSRKKGA